MQRRHHPSSTKSLSSHWGQHALGNQTPLKPRTASWYHCRTWYWAMVVILQKGCFTMPAMEPMELDYSAPRDRYAAPLSRRKRVGQQPLPLLGSYWKITLLIPLQNDQAPIPSRLFKAIILAGIASRISRNGNWRNIAHWQQESVKTIAGFRETARWGG
jgi:hypothetical protein